MEIGGLWRHPVKSLQGTPVPSATVGPTGVVGDRSWAVRDVATAAILSAKREPRLLKASAEIHGEGISVSAPGLGCAAGAAANALRDWDVRRFRPNVVVDGVHDLDDLVGARLALGPVVVDVSKRTKRCGMPTMTQPGIAKDSGVLRSLARERDLRLGVYAQVVTPGRLAVGAAITIV